MFHLIPHIKSAYQIRSYATMDIKRGVYLICNCINITILFNLNIGIYIAVGEIRQLCLKKDSKC